MVESKTILYNILAGIITGLLMIPVFYIVVNGKIAFFIYELTYNQLINTGVPPETASNIANQTASSIKSIEWMYPLGIVMNMFFISIILGIINDYLIRKIRMKTIISSIITGLMFLLVFQLLPLIVLRIVMGSWIIEVYNEYIGFHIPLLTALIYTLLLILFNSFKGPWTKILESKPKIY